MLTRRRLFATALLIVLGGPAAAEAPMPVVASFSIIGDMVATIGGARVAVTTLVGPDGDAHVYQPTPADARAVAGAEVVFVNGLAFEGWLDRLLGAAEFAGPVVVATQGLTPLAGEEDHAHRHEHADDDARAPAGAPGGAGEARDAVDPHAWQSLANARVYVANIAAGLDAADPEGTALYAARRDAYLAEIDALETEALALFDALPPARRTVVTTHDAFGYFGEAYAMTFKAPQGMSTEAEASAADVAALIRQIRADDIPAIFVENISDRRLLDRIAAETGARIGGTLYSDALSGPDGPAPTYLDMMRHNLRTLAAALSS